MVRGAPHSGAPRRPRYQQSKHKAGFLSAPQFVRQFPDIDPQLTPWTAAGSLWSVCAKGAAFFWVPELHECGSMLLTPEAWRALKSFRAIAAARSSPSPGAIVT